MKRAILIICLCLTATALPAQDRMTRQEYIDTWSSTAVEQMKQTGIPASITMAQACLESNFGTSRLATEGNNHFGIKCHGWQGKTILEDDDRKGECFRKYSNADESFKDHSDFLRHRDRYADLFALEPTDYRGWAYGLTKAGYATAPDYAQKLIRVIEENSLAALDTVREETVPPPTSAETAASIASGVEEASRLHWLSINREIHRQNGVAYVTANGYDTYASLAREYRLFKREILNFNDVGHEVPIPAGARVYIERKKKESVGEPDKHVVEKGETMYGLSQKYAVMLKYLYKYNSLPAGKNPEPGTIIRLRRK